MLGQSAARQSHSAPTEPIQVQNPLRRRQTSLPPPLPVTHTHLFTRRRGGGGDQAR